MLKIKLARIGKKGQPQYHVVIIEDKTKSGTNHVAEIGYYNPLSANKEFRLDVKAYESWMAKGARPTDTVRSLANRLAKGKTVEPKVATPSKKKVAAAVKAAQIPESTK